MNSEGSEWMKIMLAEIARKRSEQEQIRAEELLRAEEQRRGDQRNAGSK